MDEQNAKNVEEQLSEPPDDVAWEREWKDFRHVIVRTFRKAALRKLNHDETIDPEDIAAVELFLSEAIHGVHEIQGIFAVDDIGIWWWNGDGHIDEQIYCQQLIPWRCVHGITVHLSS